MNLDRIINIIKTIKEDAPTMSSGTNGFSGTSIATGPVAGYDKVNDFRTRYGKRAKNQPITRIEAKKDVRK